MHSLCVIRIPAHHVGTECLTGRDEYTSREHGGNVLMVAAKGVTPMAEEEVQVSVADAHLREFGDVVQRLERAGMRIEQQLNAVGVVTGRVDAKNFTKLARVAGVGSVERSRKVGIPPGEQ